MTFVQFAAIHGLDIRRLHSGDKIFRCPTETKPHHKNGAYFFDGRRGWVINYEDGQGLRWFDDPNATPWTDAERQAWERRREKARKERDDLARYAARTAASMMEDGLLEPHNYLVSKGLPTVRGLVSSKYELVVPMRSAVNNSLAGAQVIKLEDNAWQKKMLYGTRAAGAMFRMGRKPASVLVEGYATGLSLAAACKTYSFDVDVIVAFSAHNILTVLEILQREDARAGLQSTRYVFADHDASGTGERVARASGLPWVMSEVEGEDANDLHQRAGLSAVADKLEALIHEGQERALN